MTGLLLIPGDTHVIHAEVNWSRWIARCPICPSALALRPDTPAFECLDCGARAQVVWPDQPMVVGVERLLSMRPNVTTRNWTASETLIDLMVENGHHGLFEPLLAAIPHEPGAVPLSVEEGRIVTDMLPALPDRIRLAVEA